MRLRHVAYCTPHSSLTLPPSILCHFTGSHYVPARYFSPWCNFLDPLSLKDDDGYDGSILGGFMEKSYGIQISLQDPYYIFLIFPSLPHHSWPLVLVQYKIYYVTPRCHMTVYSTMACHATIPSPMLSTVPQILIPSHCIFPIATFYCWLLPTRHSPQLL